MIRLAPTRIIDNPRLSFRAAPLRLTAPSPKRSRHGGFVATGFAGAEGFGGKIADLLSFFSMEEAHKLECATSRHVPRNANIYRGFYPLPEKPHWSHNEIFDIGPEPAMTCPDVPEPSRFASPTSGLRSSRCRTGAAGCWRCWISSGPWRRC